MLQIAKRSPRDGFKWLWGFQKTPPLGHNPNLNVIDVAPHMVRGVLVFFPAAAHPRLTSPRTSSPLSSLSSPALSACAAST
eukprot:6746856-Pyramimonas_sp.AAC.1